MVMRENLATNTKGDMFRKAYVSGTKRPAIEPGNALITVGRRSKRTSLAGYKQREATSLKVAYLWEIILSKMTPNNTKLHTKHAPRSPGSHNIWPYGYATYPHK